MVVKTPSFRLVAMRSPGFWRYIRAISVTLFLAGASPGALFAQQTPDDPFDYFDSLLAQSVSLDQARSSTSYKFGPAVGTGIAVYICSPDAESYCPGSEVYAAWRYFLELVEDEEYSVDVAVKYMQEYYDPYLVNSIAVNWCSPEPLYGCSGSRYYSAWATYLNQVSYSGNPAAAVAAVSQMDAGLAEHIGAFECAEPTCYAAEIDLLESDELAELKSVSLQSQSGRQESSKLKYLRGPESSQSVIRKALDKLAQNRKPPEPAN